MNVKIILGRRLVFFEFSRNCLFLLGHGTENRFKLLVFILHPGIFRDSTLQGLSTCFLIYNVLNNLRAVPLISLISLRENPLKFE